MLDDVDREAVRDWLDHRDEVREPPPSEMEVRDGAPQTPIPRAPVSPRGAPRA